MPWMPTMGANVTTQMAFLLPPNSLSRLAKDAHRRYTAILANFMNADAKTRFVFNDIDLKNMDAKLAEERARFNELVAMRFRHVGRFQGSIYSYFDPDAYEYVKVSDLFDAESKNGRFRPLELKLVIFDF